MEYTNTILHGDCLEMLKQLPDKSVNTCITSPPYFGVRDYGTGTWHGGDPNCSHKKGEVNNKISSSTLVGTTTTTQNHSQESRGDICGKCGAVREDDQIGLEQTPDEYVQKIVDVFSEVWRVLRDDGTLWLNLGDSYSRTGGRGGDIPRHWDGRNKSPGSLHDKKQASDIGLKPKDLIGIPWRVAFALQSAGWYLRQDIIWHKPNPMPESVVDRCTKSHEYIFLLSKREKYYFDSEAIMEEAVTADTQSGRKFRNKRSVWTVNVKPFKSAHFATFPEDLITPCVLAGCPPNGIVLDPFMGAGTTALVALKHGRKYVGIELNQEYIDIAKERLLLHQVDDCNF